MLTTGDATTDPQPARSQDWVVRSVGIQNSFKKPPEVCDFAFARFPDTTTTPVISQDLRNALCNCTIPGDCVAIPQLAPNERHHWLRPSVSFKQWWELLTGDPKQYSHSFLPAASATETQVFLASSYRRQRCRRMKRPSHILNRHVSETLNGRHTTESEHNFFCQCKPRFLLQLTTH